MKPLRMVVVSVIIVVAALAVYEMWVSRQGDNQDPYAWAVDQDIGQEIVQLDGARLDQKGVPTFSLHGSGLLPCAVVFFTAQFQPAAGGTGAMPPRPGTGIDMGGAVAITTRLLKNSTKIHVVGVVLDGTADNGDGAADSQRVSTTAATTAAMASQINAWQQQLGISFPVIRATTAIRTDWKLDAGRPAGAPDVARIYLCVTPMA